jgi:hypothetical protein
MESIRTAALEFCAVCQKHGTIRAYALRARLRDVCNTTRAFTPVGWPSEVERVLGIICKVAKEASHLSQTDPPEDLADLVRQHIGDLTAHKAEVPPPSGLPPKTASAPSGTTPEDTSESKQKPAKPAMSGRGRNPGRFTKTARALEILQRRLKDGESVDIRLIAREAGIKDHRQLARSGNFQKWYKPAIKAWEDLQKAHEREGIGRGHAQLGREAVTWDNPDGEGYEGRVTEGGYCMSDKDD